ncbi:MAG: phosphatidylglycerophosphatase A [bacterium]|nr:phosphatidylglycerophosphatase A [bacterium]
MSKLEKVFDFTIKLLASGCFTGYSKFASGTVGCFFIGIPTYLFIYYLSHHCLFIKPDLCYALVVAILTIIGIWVSGRAEIIFAQKDSGKIVIDEVVGYLFTMFALPLNMPFILLGFVLFRIFDVWKPLFIRSLQNLPGGYGVMLDDCASGILTCVILHIIKIIFF